MSRISRAGARRGRLSRTAALGCLGAVWAASGSGCRSSTTQSDAGSTPKGVNTSAQALANKGAPKLEQPIALGEVVYDVQALGHTGQRLSLSQFSNLPQLVVFCPQTAAPACRALAEGLRDHWLEIRPHISMILEVTPEPTVLQRPTATKLKLPFLLVSDPKLSVHGAFGVQPGVAGAFLLDRERKVLWTVGVTDGAALPAQLMAALKQLDLLQPVPPI